jgi:hypothetical protein
LGVLAAKVVRATVATLLFVCLLLAAYVIHVRYFTVDVVFYSAMLDVVVAVVISAAALFLIPWFRSLGSFEKAQLCLIWLLAGYAAAISIPTVIDRSLSFYLLEKLEQRGGGIRLEAFSDVFINEYLPEHRLVDVRLTEQLASGTIEVMDGCVVLTDRGRRLVGFSTAFRRGFLPNRRLLMGEYTDDLTDPFRNSKPDVDYACSVADRGEELQR